MNCQNCKCSSDIPCQGEVHILQPGKDRAYCREPGLLTTDRRNPRLCPACVKLADRKGPVVFKRGGKIA
jgi:hypothetical protein